MSVKRVKGKIRHDKHQNLELSFSELCLKILSKEALLTLYVFQDLN